MQTHVVNFPRKYCEYKEICYPLKKLIENVLYDSWHAVTIIGTSYRVLFRRYIGVDETSIPNL